MPDDVAAPATEPTDGQIAYDAYGDARDWKTVSGSPMPAWDEQLPALRAAWERSAGALSRHLYARAMKAIAAAEKPAEPPATPAPAPAGWRELDSEGAHGGRDYATIRILAEDELGPGGAPHAYQLVPNDPTLTPEASAPTQLRFQKGPIQEVGINGITHEALLAVLIDRLKHFQRGPYPSLFNDNALWHLQTAIEWLNARTRDRARRGVEGQTKP